MKKLIAVKQSPYTFYIQHIINLEYLVFNLDKTKWRYDIILHQNAFANKMHNTRVLYYLMPSRDAALNVVKNLRLKRLESSRTRPIEGRYLVLVYIP